MVAAILKAAGLRGGLTSTDFIRVGDDIIDEGDYSGTGGARMLLRHPRAQAAVLEVARGGLLRRGLAVERANAALITNVAADHLGEYGINTVAELIEAKFIVHRALGKTSPLVLNADDAGIVSYERHLREKVPGMSWWFSLDAGNPRLASARQQGAIVCWLENDGLWLADASETTPRLLTPAGEVSASLGGMLRHNLQNAMGAGLLALAMGMPETAVRQGLRAFRGDERDNPGRGNWFEHQGVRIVVDFAHNAHGLDALAAAVAALQPKRVIIMLGQAGDRSDASIRETTRSALAMHPGILLINALPGYERGRELEEVPRLIRDEALATGMREEQLRMLPNPLAAARVALSEARAGDVLVLLALTQRREILQLVHEYCSSSGQ
jgi:UDP-N-acetylmuramyl tripeptide synthase